MALPSGARLGPYEILTAIGAGGMGEVYRARDTQLRRDVALKVLPAEVATDPDRLARFQREAELLAALNHPHVAQIHGMVEAGGTRALVMELVEGETLAARIARGSAGPDLLHQGYGGRPELHAEAEDPASVTSRCRSSSSPVPCSAPARPA